MSKQKETEKPAETKEPKKKTPCTKCEKRIPLKRNTICFMCSPELRLKFLQKMHRGKGPRDSFYKDARDLLLYYVKKPAERGRLVHLMDETISAREAVLQVRSKLFSAAICKLVRSWVAQ